MIYVWIGFGVALVLLVLWVVAIYNGLQGAKNETENAWRQIDVQLKRRYDLVPNLVETAKAYMKHERETLEAVIEARQVATNASSVKEQAAAENMLTSTLRSLMAVSENYPELRANEQMMGLQEEITSTENRIGFARQHYNDAVLRYNNRTEMFPSSLVASRYGFDKKDYFELEDQEQREPVKVQF